MHVRQHTYFKQALWHKDMEWLQVLSCHCRFVNFPVGCGTCEVAFVCLSLISAFTAAIATQWRLIQHGLVMGGHGLMTPRVRVSVICTFRSYARVGNWRGHACTLLRVLQTGTWRKRSHCRREASASQEKGLTGLMWSKQAVGSPSRPDLAAARCCMLTAGE